eukprot:TRINITY_DN12257_c0_g1_i2.p1 TRINITY_DN12257_c0_g1~~TRINITY_DN12257_c0_g1_i2.p1  ORF type:complete len:255 (-),score=57.37 TRINITY_DN12257_c0_g1_i2:30-794(-)
MCIRDRYQRRVRGRSRALMSRAQPPAKPEIKYGTPFPVVAGSPEAEPWTAEHRRLLNQAYVAVSPGDPHFWNGVAQIVGKPALECAAEYQQLHKKRARPTPVEEGCSGEKPPKKDTLRHKEQEQGLSINGVPVESRAEQALPGTGPEWGPGVVVPALRFRPERAGRDQYHVPAQQHEDEDEEDALPVRYVALSPEDARPAAAEETPGLLGPVDLKQCFDPYISRLRASQERGNPQKSTESKSDAPAKQVKKTKR